MSAVLPSLALLLLSQPAVAIEPGHPPFVNVTGTCPGTLTLDVENVTPGAEIRVFTGNEPGVTDAQPTNECVGNELDMEGRMRRIGVLAADGNGQASYSNTVTDARICDRYVQAVDMATCATSHVEPVAPRSTLPCVLRLTDVIPVPGSVNTNGLALLDGVFYTWDFDGDRLVRFTSDGTDLGTLPVSGIGFVSGLTADGGSLWMDSEGATQDLFQIDPVTGNVLSRVGTGVIGGNRGLTDLHGDLWHAGLVSTDTAFARVDIKTGGFLAEVLAPGGAQTLAVASDGEHLISISTTDFCDPNRSICAFTLSMNRWDGSSVCSAVLPTAGSGRTDPVGLTATPDALYVLDEIERVVYVFSP